MTGFGRAAREGEGLRVVVEAKTVNGRFLKLSLKTPPTLTASEQSLEAMVKARIRRGSVTLTVNLQPTDPGALVAVNEEVVRAYQVVFRRLGLGEDRIPTLPGVIEAGPQQSVADSQWKVIAAAAEAALDDLIAMRGREGAALGEVLLELCEGVDTLRREVGARSPEVVTEYQHKLHDRIATLLEERETLEPDHLAREVAVFASRCDITEEVDRLGAHLGQMRTLLTDGGEVGRTLEFIAQELHREVNTIASKSADAEIARLAVALKAEVEKIKEQVANIE